jgi:uncharacterized protein YecE (DUF72 family)
MALLIGTSGFDYPHWRGRFYPASVRGGDRLAYYAAHFRAVELNVTFYRMPAESAFRRWAAAAPEGFVFAVKASRYLTHVRRLREPEPAVRYLMARAGLLGVHLGPILLQLPPDMPVELDRLAETLSAFEAVAREAGVGAGATGGAEVGAGRARVVAAPALRVAVEVRHESWFRPEFEALLREHGAALCLADRRGPRTPIWRTADWTYVRFHEGRGDWPGYGDSELEAWAGWLREVWGSELSGYAFFNNDARGCAIDDARRFARLVEEA